MQQMVFGVLTLFWEAYIWLKNGENFYVQLKKGVLPEAFLDDFVKEEILYD